MPDNAVGPASLLECSRNLHQVLVIDEEADTVDVELGIVRTLSPVRWHATGGCCTPQSNSWSATPPRPCSARHFERAIVGPEGKVSRLGREGFPGASTSPQVHSIAWRSRRCDPLVAAKVDRSLHVRA
jgi:hypothetical protein